MSLCRIVTILTGWDWKGRFSMDGWLDVVGKAWDNREDPAILTTVDANGVPNSIYVTCVSKYDERTLVVADNYFDKTRKNIMNGGQGSILFMTKDKKAYQVKGRLDYNTDGPVFDDMKRWNSAKHPGHAAVSMTMAEAYQGGTKLS